MRGPFPSWLVYARLFEIGGGGGVLIRVALGEVR